MTPPRREPRCCSEWKCRRSQPIRLVRSELSGSWYAVTRWKERPGVPGAIEAIDKHRLPEDLQLQLERMRDGNIAYRDLVPEEPA